LASFLLSRLREAQLGKLIEPLFIGNPLQRLPQAVTHLNLEPKVSVSANYAAADK
jgi:hypothetical protein